MKLYQVLEPFEVGRIGEGQQGQFHHYTELRWINLSFEREEIRQYTHFSYVNEVSSSKRTLDCLLNQSTDGWIPSISCLPEVNFLCNGIYIFVLNEKKRAEPTNS